MAASSERVDDCVKSSFFDGRVALPFRDALSLFSSSQQRKLLAKITDDPKLSQSLHKNHFVTSEFIKQLVSAIRVEAATTGIGNINVPPPPPPPQPSQLGIGNIGPSSGSELGIGNANIPLADLLALLKSLAPAGGQTGIGNVGSAGAGGETGIGNVNGPLGSLLGLLQGLAPAGGQTGIGNVGSAGAGGQTGIGNVNSR